MSIKTKNGIKSQSKVLEISLILRTASNGAPIAGPIPGNFDEVSSCRACLTMPSIRIGSHHLFYSPGENPETCLYLELKRAEEEIISIPVQPVWLDRDFSEQSMPFQLGVEFLVQPDDNRLQNLRGFTADAGERSGH